MKTYQTTQNTLEVPGARLYYETKGSGPLLLFIPGANGEHTIFTPLSHHLAEHYTVLTYDRRGFSQSQLVGPQDYERRLETDADDVRRLVAHLSHDRPATIFGSSSGALVALTVLAKFPWSVRVLVAHEPPAVNLLPDAEKWHEFFAKDYQTYKKSGWRAGIKSFASHIAVGADVELMEKAGDMGEYSERNMIYWFDHELIQYSHADLDLDALGSHADRLVLACGSESHDRMPSWPNAILAKKFNKEILELPSGHFGYILQPKEFAHALLGGLKKMDNRRSSL